AAPNRRHRKGRHGCAAKRRGADTSSSGEDRKRVTRKKKCTSRSRRPQQVCPVNKENRNALLRRRLHFPQLRSRRLRGIYIRPLVLAAHYSHWRLVSAP